MALNQYKQVSFDDEMLILVNENDEEIGFKDKASCHMGDGILHRAFSVFIFNQKGQLLIQKRSKSKKLWPNFWSNSCCSHPRKGEIIESAAQRRLEEELGIQSKLKFIFKFQYHAAFNKIGSENEVCSVYIGNSDGPVTTNENEISEWQYISLSDLGKEIENRPEKYTPWFKIEWEKLRNSFWDRVQILWQSNTPEI
jgi:isopentenyl-diphosphate delta-isomerase